MNIQELDNESRVLMFKYIISKVKPKVRHVADIPKHVSIRTFIMDDEVDLTLAFIEPKSDTSFTLYLFEKQYNCDTVKHLVDEITWAILHEFRHINQYINNIFPEMRDFTKNVPYNQLRYEIDADKFADDNIEVVDTKRIVSLTERYLNKLNKAYL